MVPVPEAKSRIVRVVTYGKDLEAVEQEVIASLGGGAQVLVNAACASDRITARPDSDKAAVAAWAEALSGQNGFSWRRVGLDVLFKAV